MLTAKKRAFINYYKLHRNATEAAKLAGYSLQTATTKSDRLTKDVDISLALAQWEKEEAEKVAKLVPSKDNFVLNTFQKEIACEHWPTKAKLWELGGKALGYLSDDNKTGQNLFQLLCNDLNLNIVLGQSSSTSVQLNDDARSVQLEGQSTSQNAHGACLPTSDVKLNDAPLKNNHIDIDSKST